jgi:hypothetical protein
LSASFKDQNHLQGGGMDLKQHEFSFPRREEAAAVFEP